MDSSALLSLFEKLKTANDQQTAQLLWKFRLATDLRLFAAAYFPHYCQLAFNELHNDLFNSDSFMERAIRLARAAPRGYAKSTLEALIEPIHDVCYGLENFIVIFSNTQDQAFQKLRDIRSEVLTNSALANDYGIHFRVRTPGESEYTLYCGDHACLFSGFGSGTEVRGIRFGSFRPTKIIVDDGEHSEEVLNEAIRRKYEDWMFQVVSKLGTKDTNIKIIGTILHPESLLSKLIANPAYNGKIYKAVTSWSNRQDLWDQWQQLYTNIDDPDRFSKSTEFYNQNKDAMLSGTAVLWPEKESYLDLMKELIETGRRAFMKEKQNEPIGGDEALFETLHWYRETSEGLFIERSQTLIPWKDLKGDNGQWLNSYGVVDPATGQTKAKPGKLGDYACILSGLRDPKGRLLVHEDWTQRAAPSKQISEVFEHHLIYNYQKFGVETNLYRNLLLPNIISERKRIEQDTKKVIQLPLYDIEQVENKEKRIYTLEPKVQHGWILFNRALSQTFVRMMEAFPHGDHDDGPDALEMLWGLMNGRYKASALSMNPMGGR